MKESVAVLSVEPVETVEATATASPWYLPGISDGNANGEQARTREGIGRGSFGRAGETVAGDALGAVLIADRPAATNYPAETQTGDRRGPGKPGSRYRPNGGAAIGSRVDRFSKIRAIGRPRPKNHKGRKIFLGFV